MDIHVPQTNGNDLLMSRANDLVGAAHAAAAQALPISLAKFPFLKRVVTTPDDEMWWSALLTIAAVYIAATRLRNLELGQDREAKLMTRVTERLIEFNANAESAFEDCKEFFGRNFDALTEAGHEARFVASDSIGLWIAWNLWDRAPETQSELEFVRGIGVTVTHRFFSWWEMSMRHCLDR